MSRKSEVVNRICSMSVVPRQIKPYRLNEVHKQYLLCNDCGAHVLIYTSLLQEILQTFRLLSNYVDTTATYNTSIPVNLSFL